MTEQEQLARFAPALDALERAVATVDGFWELVDGIIDPFHERVIVCFDNGMFDVDVVGGEWAAEAPDKLVLPCPEIGNSESCIQQLRRALHDAVCAPEA